MRKLRVLVMMHAELVPPVSLEGHSEEEINRWKMEHDVLGALEGLGHEVRPVGVEDDLKPVREAMNEFRPHVVFNMLMHFHDAGIYDSAVVAWLELRKQPYTGCNPRGLFVAGDKALSKKVMSYHRIRSPRFLTVPTGKSVRSLPKGLEFPLFVKSRSEHASTGIAHASIVHDLEKLRERVDFIHRNVGTAALCEEYIEGRELTIGVMGNDRLSAAPLWETFMEKLPSGVPNIYTSKLKWDRAYQRKVGLRTGPVGELPEGMEERVTKIAKRLYRALGLSGFARIDLRMDAKDRLFILEANPNPDLCFGEDFAEGFDQLGVSYPQLIQKILNLGLRYDAPWKG